MSYSRIEASQTRKGEYIAQCYGAQRVRKGGKGWETYALASGSGVFIYETAGTLAELNKALDYREKQLHSEAGVLLGALQGLLSRCEKHLPQGCDHEGLSNADALAKAHCVVAKATKHAPTL